jgi:hypothetical protein
MFDTLADLKRSIRANLSYFPMVRWRLQTRIAKRYLAP